MVAGRLRRTTLLAASLGVLASCSSSSHRALSPSTTSSTASPSSGPTSTTAPVLTARWASCTDGAGPKGYQCATIQVPRDPAHPGVGGTIGLALDRHRASGQKIGSLLIDPGGPGASGVDFLGEIVPVLPKSVLQRFDVVGFDPPGVGRSAPIVCLDGPGLDKYFHQDPDPPSSVGLDDLIAGDRAFVQGCEARSGAELPYVSTVDAAMDMDYIRQAVGDSSLTYMGFSYGTFLGATYAQLYPTRIRAMVLDGALDPSLPVVQNLDFQAAGFDAELKAALEACTSNRKCPWKPVGDPVAAFENMLSATRSHPLAVAGTARTVGPAEFLYGAGWTLYSTDLWPALDTALAAAAQGNGRFMLSLADSYDQRSANGTYKNELEAIDAVDCLDAGSPSIGAIEADASAARAAAPVFGVPNLYGELVCATWPIQSNKQPAAIHAPGSPAIVVVGTTGDPATPYQDAQALASQLDHGVLLTRVGNGHTGYLYSSCIRNYVDAYLINLAVPSPGIRCASN